MTIVAEAVPTTRVAAGSHRRTALVAGVFYLLTFAASIPAVFLLGPVLSDPNYIVGAGSDPQVLAGCLLDVITAFTGIGTAVALFPVVRRQNEGVALGFVTSRLVEAFVILIGVVSLLAVVTLRRDLGGAAGTDQAALVTVGNSLVGVRNWTFLLGPTLMASVNALLLGSLLYRSRLVPRIIPLVGLLGAPLLLASTIVAFFGYNQQLPLVTGIVTAPIFAWELSVGLWMTFKGFKPSHITDRA